MARRVSVGQMFIGQPTGIGVCRKCVNAHENATRLINAALSENPPEIQSSLTATRHGARRLPGLERPGYSHTAAARLQVSRRLTALQAAKPRREGGSPGGR